MSIHETLIFIKKPIKEIAASVPGSTQAATVADGNEVAYIFEGKGPQNTSFGFAADLDAPDGASWTQLLVDNDDPEILARLLKQLDVSPDQLEAATDWDGAPLVDLAPIIGHFGSLSKPMNKKALVASVREIAGLNATIAQSAVDAVFSVITAELSRGGDVRLVGFGNFTVARRTASVGRNPQTGTEVSIPGRKMPKFAAGKNLKDAVN